MDLLNLAIVAKLLTIGFVTDPKEDTAVRDLYQVLKKKVSFGMPDFLFGLEKVVFVSYFDFQGNLFILNTSLGQAKSVQSLKKLFVKRV